MKSVSQTYKEAKGYGFSLRLETVLEGRSAFFTYDDLLSFKISGNGSSDENLTFGYVSACEISFSIDNIDGRWDDVSFEGVEWQLSMGKYVSWDDYEDFPIGTFTTTEALEVDGAVNIKASDGMIKFDKRFKGINFPCTLHDLVLQCCKQCGVTFATTRYTNMDFEISGAYQLTQITCRKVISLVAELCGRFAIMNGNGNLEFKWFDSRSPALELGADDIEDFKPDKVENIIGGTSVIFNGTEYTYGDGSKKISLTEDHRLLMYASPEEIRDLLISIYEETESMLVFSTASFTSIGEPALEIGDVVSVIDRKGKRHNILVSGFTLSGNLKMNVVSPGIVAEEESGSSTSTESGSIPRETSEAVSSFISKSERVSLSPGGASTNFLSQRFSSESGALPLVMLTIAGECTSGGLLSIKIIVDGVSYSEYLDNVVSGSYLKTIICPLEDLISGNHSVEVQLISTGTLSIIFPNEEKPSVGSVMIIQGRKLGQASSWDGLVTIGDVFGRIRVRTDDIFVSGRDEVNSVELYDESATGLCQTISVSVTRPKVELKSPRVEITTSITI